MATQTKSRSSNKTEGQKQAPQSKAPAKTEAPKAEAKTETPATPTKPTYRENADFTPALKSAKASAKGNGDLMSPLQLITHLAWKSPNGTVGWAKGTTEAVVTYADDIAVPAGTSIPDAMSAALGAARKAAKDEPQNKALSVLAKVIDEHNAA